MSARQSIASRARDTNIARGLRLVCLPMGVRDVVTFTGSFYGGDIFSPAGKQAAADITVAMLDKGTLHRDKFEIGAALESVGASISFNSDSHRVSFSARCLKSDVPLLIELLAEQLREPAFHDEDLISLKKRAMGSLQRQRENTDEQARIAFSQLLYPEGHPNYSYSIDQQMADIEDLSTDDFQAFHAQHYGLGSMLVVITGDLDQALLEGELARRLGDWPMLNITPPALNGLRASTIGSGGSQVISMPDKTSVDLLLGMAVGIDREHDDYLPLMMATYILGGNFSARLMANVRDQAGLTYGIGSMVGGASYGIDGFWAIHGTFAPPLLDKGRKATLEQLDKWLASGVTGDELAAKQTTITGSYQVGLASTKGMAGTLIDVLERDRGVAYLDEYPDRIRDLTLEQVNSAIGTYIDRERLTIVAAGTLVEDN